jgi:hypothetical protein
MATIKSSCHTVKLALGSRLDAVSCCHLVPLPSTKTTATMVFDSVNRPW